MKTGPVNNSVLLTKIFYSTVLAACFTFLPFADASAQPVFQVNKDNSIQIGDLHFQDMVEYVESDYFRGNGRRCGTQPPPAVQDDRAARSVDDCTFQLTRIQQEYWLSGLLIELPVWFHVLYSSSGIGNVVDSAISDQLQVMNEDFGAKLGTLGGQGFDTRIQFTLAGITRTENDLWFNDGPGYKAALARDPSRYINIYINTASGDLGYSTYPQLSAGSIEDGVVVHYSTIGGRDNGNGNTYNQGRTLVHEMGHYLGLFHTFDQYGTCSNSYFTGDLIVDTTSENTPHYECVQGDSCGTPDPIHNYMNYTPDACMLEFTREQANRMVCSIVNYRSGLHNLKFDGSIVPLLEQLLLKSP